MECDDIIGGVGASSEAQSAFHVETIGQPCDAAQAARNPFWGAQGGSVSGRRSFGQSIVRAIPLRRLFADGSIPSKTAAGIARMCVLYEDLRIECVGFGLKPDHPTERPPDWSLDRAGFKLRQVYFFRRAIGTSSEFFEAVDLLNKDPDFHRLLQGVGGSEAVKAWEESSSFFNSQRHRYWKDIRNDVGGHFGASAALFAVTNLEPSVAGTLELHSAREKEGGVVLSFSGEIAATALLRRLTGSTVEDKLAGLFAEAQEVFRHATHAVQTIVVYYLWDKSK